MVQFDKVPFCDYNYFFAASLLFLKILPILCDDVFILI